LYILNWLKYLQLVSLVDFLGINTTYMVKAIANKDLFPY